jgi:hypothetical protein
VVAPRVSQPPTLSSCPKLLERYAHHLWELARDLIHDGDDAYLILDDSVQEKRYATTIDLVRYQYSGNAHDVVQGIGIVNLVVPVQGYFLRLDSDAD